MPLVTDIDSVPSKVCGPGHILLDFNVCGLGHILTDFKVCGLGHERGNMPHHHTPYGTMYDVQQKVRL